MCGLLSNGVWTGVGLKSLLEEAGVKPEAREVLFLGLDMEKEKKFQAGNREYEAPHGRAIHLLDALHPDTMLAFALNGQPIPREQGFPVRLLVPGWYGMTQVKWLGRIEVLDRRYEGQHQVRNYLSLRSVPDARRADVDRHVDLEEPAEVDRGARDPAAARRRSHLQDQRPGLGRTGADQGGRSVGRRRRVAARHARRAPRSTLRRGCCGRGLGAQPGARHAHAGVAGHRRQWQGAAHR